jgi:hypothetical protein
MRQLAAAFILAVTAAFASPHAAAAQQSPDGPSDGCKACEYLGWRGYACRLLLPSGYYYCYVDPNYPYVCEYGPDECPEGRFALDGSAVPGSQPVRFTVERPSGGTVDVGCSGAVIARRYPEVKAVALRRLTEYMSI